jgi:hypothetical protein
MQVSKRPRPSQYGVPGVFATLGIYFMYDVKQFDPVKGSRA